MPKDDNVKPAHNVRQFLAIYKQTNKKDCKKKLF